MSNVLAVHKNLPVVSILLEEMQKLSEKSVLYLEKCINFYYNSLSDNSAASTIFLNSIVFYTEQKDLIMMEILFHLGQKVYSTAPPLFFIEHEKILLISLEGILLFFEANNADLLSQRARGLLDQFLDDCDLDWKYLTDFIDKLFQLKLPNSWWKDAHIFLPKLLGKAPENRRVFGAVKQALLNGDKPRSIQISLREYLDFGFVEKGKADLKFNWIS